MKTLKIRTWATLAAVTVAVGLTALGATQVQAEKNQPIPVERKTAEECPDCPPAFVDGQMTCYLAICGANCEYVCVFDGDGTVERK